MASRAAAATPRRRRPVADGRSTVRWDRVGRAGLLTLVAVIALLYISGGVAVFNAWRQNDAVSSSLVKLEREHSKLLREHAVLSSRSTVEASALRMGMTHPGEQQYLVTGLPRD